MNKTELYWKLTQWNPPFKRVGRESELIHNKVYDPIIRTTKMTYIIAQNLITKAVENKYKKRRPRERERESFFI